MKKGHFFFALAAFLALASCTKDGDVIKQPDPNDAASSAPLVTVFYDPNALGDGGYNDLIYQGVESAARQYGLRTLQLSPSSYEEGMTYLQTMFAQMEAASDTVRRLFVVAAGSFDDFLRKNNSRLESHPYTDLLYMETSTPLSGKGSTFYMPYYSAMYEAGAIAPVVSPEVLLVGANQKVQPVVDAIKGFEEGFNASPVKAQDGDAPRQLVTRWLSDEISGGFAVADSTAFKVMGSVKWEGDNKLLVPVCGGAGVTFRRLCDMMMGFYQYAGIDSTVLSSHCNMSVVKHVDRAVSHCIGQWLSAEGMPKHQIFSLKDGYTEVVLHPFSEMDKSLYAERLTNEMRQSIHQQAIEKEVANEN